MKKLLSASVLCLGLAGTATVRAQQTLFVTNSGQLADSSNGGNPTPGFPVAGRGFISAIVPTAADPTIGTASTFLSGLNGPAGIVYDGAGSLVFNSGFYQMPAVTGSVISTSIASGAQTTLSFGGGILGPAGLATGPGGGYYNVNAYFPNANSITLTPSAGTAGPPAVFTSSDVNNVHGTPNPSFAQGSGVFGIAYNAAVDANHFYVSASSSILKVNTATGATDATITSNLFGSPTDLTFGPDGALYVSNNGNDDVLRIAAPASSTPAVSIYALNNTLDGSTLLDGPEGLAFAPGSNDLYVAADGGTVALIPGTLNGGVLTTANPFGATEYADLGPDANPGFLAFAPVPEPSTYALFGVAGLVLTVSLARRRQMTLRAWTRPSSVT